MGANTRQLREILKKANPNQHWAGIVDRMSDEHVRRVFEHIRNPRKQGSPDGEFASEPSGSK